ncbi:MAG: nitrilase [Deltaproteobacteria bacterium]|nr:nitrilase [Deltaproteobacteria bacterium]
MHDIRVGAAVCRAPVRSVQETLRRMRRWVRKARDQGADILCFPEMNVTGYSIRHQIREAAEPIPGPVTAALSELAAAGNMVLLAGMAEKGKRGGIYASHLAVFPDKRINVYRKLHIAPPEEGLFTPGNRLPLFEFKGVTFGIQLCYDAHFPELSTAMALKGAEVLFFPHASPRGSSKEKYFSWMRHLPARAFDNSLFAVACNPVGENGEGLSFPGVALVLGPDGRVLAKCLGKKEGLLVVDLKKRDLTRVRAHRMQHFLPRRRPEIYRLQRADDNRKT